MDILFSDYTLLTRLSRASSYHPSILPFLLHNLLMPRPVLGKDSLVSILLAEKQEDSAKQAHQVLDALLTFLRLCLRDDLPPAQIQKVLSEHTSFSPAQVDMLLSRLQEQRQHNTLTQLSKNRLLDCSYSIKGLVKDTLGQQRQDIYIDLHLTILDSSHNTHRQTLSMDLPQFRHFRQQVRALGQTGL